MILSLLIWISLIQNTRENMVAKKKILFFMWSFSLGGGAEKILSTIVSNLDPEKYDIDILEMEHFDKGYESVPKHVRILKSLQDYRQTRWLRAFLWRMRIYFPRLARRLLVKDDYDVEVSFTIMNPPLLFSKRREVKKISWIHGSIEELLKDSSKRESHRSQLDAANTIVGISKKTSNSIKEVYPDYTSKLQTIYNGYDFQTILEKSQEKIDIEIAPQSICTIGRIEENKGSDRVVEVIRLLHQEGKNYHLYFIGAGDMEEELKKRVKEYGIEDYVHFLGYQKNPYQYLSQTKVLLSMSKQEGFPGVYVEALSLGLPFISTDVGGAEELSQEGRFGQIIESNQEAAQAITNYMTSASNFDVDEASQFIQQFTITKQIEQVEKLLEE
ncbi:glycosyltransferase [Streptococcus pneumoniae]|uniref:Glycosyltransferase n=2 Tax=Streptococcus pneumoniae TaxID=1313 RepID=A0AAW9W2N9_STREE|nr:glycosyltransferase [Streptococcus pneumoniae]MTV75831.1 glycosyltransferase [Streptococcus pneumoniae]NMG52790.1 glycosyltransferase [Streptococcus pneumoniae]NMG61965.1 glycosyltransferase [Streptococcus pneumoniae]NMG87905.1 glycosyltransferase [Streptococcus pneumoniae]